MSRQFTEEEVRDKFLKQVWAIMDYWRDQPDPLVERMEGAVFSILVMLDGGAIAMPGFVVAPSPHPDDKAYHIAEGEDYYPEGPEAECDIAGGLHELFYSARPKG